MSSQGDDVALREENGRLRRKLQYYRSASGAQQASVVVLAVDIGATRTKFMLHRDGKTQRLAPKLSSEIWKDETLRGEDKFDPDAARQKLVGYLRKNGIDCDALTAVVFSVPGTVVYQHDKVMAGDELTKVKNMPSFSPKFRGFDFKAQFRGSFKRAKISAVADNMAAALGVANHDRRLKNALVLVLGTVPAVSTFFRERTYDPSAAGEPEPGAGMDHEFGVTQGDDTYLETGIWQTWVWFSKIELSDPYGYCGGLNVERNPDGSMGRIILKKCTQCKIPHKQARIRFAVDSNTWKRLRGEHPELPKDMQASLSEEQAAAVWTKRVQAAVNVLAAKFHAVYGAPEAVYVLGGNSVRCHGHVTSATYITPDFSQNVRHSVPVVIQSNDAEQQRIHMSGLVYSTHFKVKQVIAPGQDPLARGWTRGGEIYIWRNRLLRKQKEERRKLKVQAKARAIPAKSSSRSRSPSPPRPVV